MSLDFTIMENMQLTARDPTAEIERELDKEYREIHESIVQVKGIQVSLLDSLLGNKPELQIIEVQTKKIEDNLLVADKNLVDASNMSNSTKVLTACAALGTVIGGPLGLIVTSSVSGLIIGGLTGSVCGLGLGRGVNNWLK